MNCLKIKKASHKTTRLDILTNAIHYIHHAQNMCILAQVQAQFSIYYSSPIQTITVGNVIATFQSCFREIRGLYRRSGISPCPEELLRGKINLFSCIFSNLNYLETVQIGLNIVAVKRIDKCSINYGLRGLQKLMDT